VAVHIYTQTIHRTTQITTEQHKKQTNVEECGPCPVFASFTPAFALQLRKSHGKTSVRVKKTCQVKKTHSQSTVYLLPKTPTYYKILTNPPTHTHTHTHTHTLQNNIKPPQYKLKQNTYRKKTQWGERTVPSF
jgi:hypothetical protein